MGLFDYPELLHPKIHCFAKCHFCKKLIAIKRDQDDNLDLDERECPHCGVFIDRKRIEATFVDNLMLTAGVAWANKIQSLDLAFIPFLIVGVILTFSGYPLWFRILNLVIYISPLIIIVRWFQKYWLRFRFDDQEYLDAAKGVKKSFLLWLVANILNWSLLLFQPIGLFHS